MFKDGKDQGYLDDPQWWFNHPEHQFRIAKLDEDYPAEYFPLAEPPKEALNSLVNYAKHYYKKITDKDLTNVFEFGFGGGWTLEAFEASHVKIFGLEGTSAGYDEASVRLFPLGGLIHEDIRHKLGSVAPRFDMAVATEILEHVEIPFHAMAISNIIGYSHLVWFSSEPPEIPNRPHLHHPGEMPLKYWQNLFDFYGYGCYMLPDEVFRATEGRGRCIFYNKSVYNL